MASKQSFGIYEDPPEPTAIATLRLQIEKCRENIKAKEELLDEAYETITAGRLIVETSIMSRESEAKARQYTEKTIELLEKRNKDLVMRLECVAVARNYLYEVIGEKEGELGELEEEVGRLKERVERLEAVGGVGK